MKKFFVALLMLLTIPAFATGVGSGASTADCDNATLDTYSGTSNLSAGWQPNTIDLHWYNGDTEITSGVQTSCVYDGTLTPPATIPTKTGYTFKGWKLRVFDLTTLNTSINGSRYGYKDVPPYSQSSLTEYFGLTEDLTWAAEFSYGMVYGEASCNTTDGTYSAVVDWNTNTFEYTIFPQNIKSADTFEKSITGARCWCRVTNVVPTGKLSQKASPTPWVFFTGSSWAISSCSHYCPLYCGLATKEIAEFRQAIYGQAN